MPSYVPFVESRKDWNKTLHKNDKPTESMKVAADEAYKALQKHYADCQMINDTNNDKAPKKQFITIALRSQNTTDLDLRTRIAQVASYLMLALNQNWPTYTYEPKVTFYSLTQVSVQLGQNCI
jgi:hypothetical protein